MVCQESLDTCVIQTVGRLPLPLHQHHAFASPPYRLTSPPHGRVVRNLLPVRPNPLVGLCQAVPTQPNFCQAAAPLSQQPDHLKYRTVLLTLNICWEPAQPRSYCPGWQEPSWHHGQLPWHLLLASSTLSSTLRARTCARPPSPPPPLCSWQGQKLGW